MEMSRHFKGGTSVLFMPNILFTPDCLIRPLEETEPGPLESKTEKKTERVRGREKKIFTVGGKVQSAIV